MADDNQLNPPPLSILPQTSPIGPGLPQSPMQMPTLGMGMPSAPQVSPDLQQAILEATRAGTHGVQQEVNRANQYENQIMPPGQGPQVPLSQQAAELAPHLAYHGWGGNVDAQHPTGHFFEPVSGVGSFLRDLGRGALGVGAATAPGRAIQDVAYSGPRNQYADIIRQIKERQQGAEQATQATAPLSNLGAKPLYAGAQVAKTQAQLPIEMMDANTRRLAVDNSNRLRQEGLDIEKDLGNKKITVEQAEVRMKQVVAEIMQGTATKVAGMYADQRDRAVQTQASQDYLENESKYWLQRFLGMAPAPPVGTAAGTAPAANAPAQNAPTNNAKPQKKGGAVKVEKWGRNKNGRMVRLQ